MSDKLDPWLLGLATLCLTALATFILWGVLSSSFAGLMAFGLAYGILAGGWSSLWTAFVQPIASAYRLFSVKIILGHNAVLLLASQKTI